MPRGYSRARSIHLLVACLVAAPVVWLNPVSWTVNLLIVSLGLLSGFGIGALGWARTRSRIDKRNVLILYVSDSPFYLLLFTLYAFKSFPLFAGWVAFRGWSHSDTVMSAIAAVACLWVGYAAALLRGVVAHERAHGPIRTKFFTSPSVTGQQGMIGQRGRVTKSCAPQGKVEVRAEIWDAVSIDGTVLEPGQPVVVRDIEELKLMVEKNGEKNGV